MNKLARTILGVTLIILVVIPLGLLGTCSIFYGAIGISPPGMGRILLIGLGVGVFGLARWIYKKI